MEVQDILEDYKWESTVENHAECIERMVKFISKSAFADVDSNFLKIMQAIHAEEYSMLIGYFSKISNSEIIIAKYLKDLISSVSITNFAPFIRILKKYYPKIKLSDYQEWFEEKLGDFCVKVDTYHQYNEIERIWNTGIFQYSLEHYLVEDLLVKQLEDTYQVSFIGENIIYKNKIYELLQNLKEEAKAHGISDHIKYVDFGSTSIVLQVGAIVMKIGGERETDEIPEHARILKPLYYEYFSDSRMAIEIQPYIDTAAIPPYTEYDIIIELYESGIAWLDPGIRNIGRLENGTYVICDCDYIYYLEDLDVLHQEQILKLYNHAKEEQEKRIQHVLKKQFIHKK